MKQLLQLDALATDAPAVAALERLLAAEELAARYLEADPPAAFSRTGSWYCDPPIRHSLPRRRNSGSPPTC